MLDDGNENQQKCKYKMNSDIQVAGMLVYYILSGGYHPFGSGARVEANILDEKYELKKVNDVETKDLIESMIAKDPKKRLTAEEAVKHPFFWDDNSGLELPGPLKNSPNDLRGLLRFLRNILIHQKETFEKHKMFKDLFPDYFISAQKLAKEMGWKA